MSEARHPRCECHSCTQARAQMLLGGMWNLKERMMEDIDAPAQKT